MGVCMDRKYTSMGQAGGTLSNVTFSSDSNHCFGSRGSESISACMQTANPCSTAACTFSRRLSGCSLADRRQSGMVILVQDGTSFKRVSITPASSSSLAAMQGGGPTKAGTR